MRGQGRVVMVACKGHACDDSSWAGQGQIGGHVAVGEFAGRESRAGRGAWGEPADAEGAPVGAVGVPGDQVPVALEADQAVRLGRADAVAAARACVVEAQLLTSAEHLGNRYEGVHGDLGGRDHAGPVGAGRYPPPCWSPRTTCPSRRWAERGHNVVRWTELDRGGHFLAMEAPDLLVGDVREFFGKAG